MSIILGAYASSPTFLGAWDPWVEQELFDGVATIPGVRGLELPWFGDVHQHDPEWLVGALRSEWSIVYTTIQSTARRAIEDPTFGLASEDADGRAAAVDVIRGVAAGVATITDRLGRPVVEAVELHSQPRGLGGGRGSADALARSLDELLALDWRGAHLLIEHADAPVPERPTPKGYLGLAAEIDAVRRFAGAPVGLEINWGRSAIETRDGDRVVDHIVEARESGTLRSLFLSGAADRDGAFGNAWDDAHPPFAPTEGYHAFEAASVLTADRARTAIAAAGDLDILGIKFGFRPTGGPIGAVVAQLREAVRLTHDLAS